MRTGKAAPEEKSLSAGTLRPPWFLKLLKSNFMDQKDKLYDRLVMWGVVFEPQTTKHGQTLYLPVIEK